MSKIHHRVAEVLGMSVEDDEVLFDEDEPTISAPETALVPMPEELAEVDNPELPALQDELMRIEHGQRQTELLLEKGLEAVQKALSELPLIVPQYKPRAVEAAAELFKAVADLTKFKVEVQIKLTELKLKKAAFTRTKGSNNPLGSGNTFVVNREVLIRGINDAYQSEPDSGDD